jgi:predicted small integral membrane protein
MPEGPAHHTTAFAPAAKAVDGRDERGHDGSPGLAFGQSDRLRGGIFVIETRIAKIGMVAALALFALLVAFDNLADYGSNYAFVRHVLSMDTVFPDNQLLSRRIATPWVWQAAYALIIAGEAATGLWFAVAGVAMARALRAEASRFIHAKRLVSVAAGLGFAVWFFGFMVVGGEWFQMWQSAKWNGQEAAFRFYMTILAVVIFVHQRDHDLV